MRRLAIAVGLALAVGTASAPSQTPPDPLEDFAARVSAYSVLRADLAKDLPLLSGANDPEYVRTVESALAARVRAARGSAKQGDLFTSQAGTAIRRILREIQAETWKAIMDENPGAFPNRVNDSYPKSKPLSSVPPDLLARLPALPEGLQYRFVGAVLILHDTQANLIVDRLPEAISLGPPRL
jgi:hypothetical protein